MNKYNKFFRFALILIIGFQVASANAGINEAGEPVFEAGELIENDSTLRLKCLSFRTEPSEFENTPPMDQMNFSIESWQEELQKWQEVGQTQIEYRRENCFGYHLRIARIDIHHEFQNQGLGTKAIATILNYFDNAKFHIFKAETDFANEASKRIFKKNGFKYVGKTIPQIGANIYVRSHGCSVCNSTSSSTSSKIMSCSKCGIAHYCSKEHQKENWISHKPYCRYFSEQARDSEAENCIIQ